MKKIKINKNIKIIGFITLFILFFASMFAVLDYLNYKVDVRECEDYSYYGYVTEIQFGFNEVFWTGGGDVCVIYMDDGTKLPLDDFKIINVKTPLVKYYY